LAVIFNFATYYGKLFAQKLFKLLKNCTVCRHKASDFLQKPLNIYDWEGVSRECAVIWNRERLRQKRSGIGSNHFLQNSSFYAKRESFSSA